MSGTAMDPLHTAQVGAGAWFKSLPDALQAALLAVARIRRLDAGQRLFSRGDLPDGLYCVVEGAVRVNGVSASGKEALLAFIEPPQWFGEIAVVDGQPRTHDAWAQDAAVLLHIPQDDLARLLQAHPGYWRDIGRLLTQKLRMAFQMLEESALLPASGRVAARLVAMAEGYGEWTDRSRRTIAVPQEQLALMLSLSRQTVNQILKQLQAQGAIRAVHGGVEILDITKLRDLRTPAAHRP